MFYICSCFKKVLCSRDFLMALQSFGDVHTGIKLDVLERYLNAYTTALKERFEIIFFDAFAGTGSIEMPTKAENHEFQLQLDVVTSDNILEGSARRALKLKNPFDRYIFVEKMRRKAAELERLKSEFPTLEDRISVRRGDANEELNKFCNEINQKHCRAVVFLDPFGNQISWETLATIAETGKIDLWYLFPAGLGVNRQISEKGVYEQHAQSLDRLLGTNEWRTSFVEIITEPDLLGFETRMRKTVNATDITIFMQKRMKEIFKGVVLERWLPLGSRNVHMYSLMFATANPSKPAIDLATRLASAVIDQRDRTQKRKRK